MKVEGKRGGGGWAQMTSAAINLEYECGGRLRCWGKLKCVLDCFQNDGDDETDNGSVGTASFMLYEADKCNEQLPTFHKVVPVMPPPKQ